ncbi:MAG: alpha/beta hydrolase, partial [Rhodanobacteraceae bacterium]
SERGFAGRPDMPAFTVPFSSYASSQAEDVFRSVLETRRRAPPLDGPIAASRAYYDKLNTARAERMERLYPVSIETCTIDGVSAQTVMPKNGVAPDQKNRVLVNLHGGAFLWGAGSGGLVESIPIASLGRTRVITVDYRQGPEHVFPAASEDVAKVYGELLKEYRAQNVGIYGCSAGGVLTGEAVAWFLHRKLPLPGAIGTFCGSLVDFGGDSAHVAAMFDGEASGLKLVELLTSKARGPAIRWCSRRIHRNGSRNTRRRC